MYIKILFICYCCNTYCIELVSLRDDGRQIIYIPILADVYSFLSTSFETKNRKRNKIDAKHSDAHCILYDPQTYMWFARRPS